VGRAGLRDAASSLTRQKPLTSSSWILRVRSAALSLDSNRAISFFSTSSLTLLTGWRTERERVKERDGSVGDAHRCGG